ncbi:MAG: hypothetical protein AAB438_01820 [Patescibacteria group bacterium]
MEKISEYIKTLHKKYEKYLPSRKFTRIIFLTFIILVVLITLFFFLSKKESFNIKDNQANLKTEDQTVLELIQNDTDGDTIPDWEEALWGTNKYKKSTFDGIEDNLYIENKKKDLDIEQERGDKTLTETDKFARQFFSAYAALKTSGEIDDQTINSFSNALGQNMTNPNIQNRYTEKDIKVSALEDTEDARIDYYITLKKLFETYSAKGLGDELDIVNNDLTVYSSTNKNTGQNQELLIIAQAYKDFAEKVIKVSVPESLAVHHLKIANSANNTGISVENMTKIINDPLVGLSGLSQYEKYSDDLVTAVEELETAL